VDDETDTDRIDSALYCRSAPLPTLPPLRVLVIRAVIVIGVGYFLSSPYLPWVRALVPNDWLLSYVMDPSWWDFWRGLIALAGGLLVLLPSFRVGMLARVQELTASESTPSEG
jgi:hypothetical protein